MKYVIVKTKAVKKAPLIKNFIREYVFFSRPKSSLVIDQFLNQIDEIDEICRLNIC